MQVPQPPPRKLLLRHIQPPQVRRNLRAPIHRLRRTEGLPELREARSDGAEVLVHLPVLDLLRLEAQAHALEHAPVLEHAVAQAQHAVAHEALEDAPLRLVARGARGGRARVGAPDRRGELPEERPDVAHGAVDGVRGARAAGLRDVQREAVPRVHERDRDALVPRRAHAERGDGVQDGGGARVRGGGLACGGGVRRGGGV